MPASLCTVPSSPSPSLSPECFPLSPSPAPARARLRRDQSHTGHFRFPPPELLRPARPVVRCTDVTGLVVVERCLYLLSTVSRYLASAPGTPTFLTLGHRSRLVRASFTPLYTSIHSPARSKLRITGLLFRLAEESIHFLPWRRLVLLKMSPRTLGD